MILDSLAVAAIFLPAVLVLLLVGRFAYQLCHRGIAVQHELVERDNAALALTYIGYYAGLVIAIGGVLSGAAQHWTDDLLDVAYFGLVSIVLMNISIIINDKIILRHFNNRKEIITDQNLGTGAVEAGSCIATGLVLYGAMVGDGHLIHALAFWALGQLGLIAAALTYDWITPYNIHDEIEKDNVPVGVATAGALIALGNLMRVGIGIDFVSWEDNLIDFALFVGIGLILLPLVRIITDRVFLPAASLADELTAQEKPNLGAGMIEAFSYISASFLLGWLL